MNDHFGQTKFKCMVQINDSEIATQCKNQRIFTENPGKALKKNMRKKQQRFLTTKDWLYLFRIGNCLGLLVSVEAMKKFIFWRLGGNYVDL